VDWIQTTFTDVKNREDATERGRILFQQKLIGQSFLFSSKGGADVKNIALGLTVSLIIIISSTAFDSLSIQITRSVNLKHGSAVENQLLHLAICLRNTL